MTDEQIIKALSCCDCREWCAECPLKDNDYCKDVFSHQAVDLINRKDAQIKKLEKIRQKQALFLEEERGQKYELYNVIKKTKSEAIKEFAERLKKEVLIDRGYEILQLGTIEYLVKEMTEVQK